MNISVSFYPIIFLLTLFYTNAHATLIDFGSTTADDVNQIEWLDVSLTRGDSIAETIERITSGDLSGEGWRYANADDVALLFTEAGAIAPYDGWSSINNNLAVPLMDLWSSTFDDGSARSTFAFISDDDLGTLTGNTILVQDFIDPDLGHLDEDFFHLSYGIYGDPYPEIGHALVRDYISAPEPATLALFCLGITGLAFLNRKKKR